VGTIAVGGVIGNNLDIAVFWKDNIKTSASFHFKTLAFIDSAFLLVAMPLYPIH